MSSDCRAHARWVVLLLQAAASARLLPALQYFWRTRSARTAVLRWTERVWRTHASRVLLSPWA